MQVTAGFIGFSRSRIEDIATAIKKASGVSLEPVRVSAADGIGRLEEVDAVFISREIEEIYLTRWLETLRDATSDMPIVLVYDSEPDGKCYLYANRFDCWLFSENDRLGRALSAAEIGRALWRGAPDSAFERRLFEVSLSAGPCSTGSESSSNGKLE